MASDANAPIIEEFRANDGRVGGYFENQSLLLLHTTGAKSGKERISPVVYFRDGARLLVAGTKNGAPTHPDWYHNIVANPAVTIEIGTDTVQARAVALAEPERTSRWDEIVRQQPGFGDYVQMTARVIPVVALERINGDNGAGGFEVDR